MAILRGYIVAFHCSNGKAKLRRTNIFIRGRARPGVQVSPTHYPPCDSIMTLSQQRRCRDRAPRGMEHPLPCFSDTHPLPREGDVWIGDSSNLGQPVGCLHLANICALQSQGNQGLQERAQSLVNHRQPEAPLPLLWLQLPSVCLSSESTVPM